MSNPLLISFLKAVVKVNEVNTEKHAVISIVTVTENNIDVLFRLP
ncbi:MAG: hypothetical protein RSB82_01855 [Victivallaceae bacterium]